MKEHRIRSLPFVKRKFITVLCLALVLMFGAGCNANSGESIPPSAEAPEPDVSSIPSEPSNQPAATYRLVFPAESVFTCQASYSAEEASIRFSKDQVENGWVSYEESLVPFSDDLLEHPDASLIMWTGIHELMLESSEIPLNDGWVCYMYRGEMNHATGTSDPGGSGTIYSAMIGRPEDKNVFCLYWNNYFETDVEEPLESFQEDDPGYVSVEDMRSFLSGIVVEENG